MRRQTRAGRKYPAFHCWHVRFVDMKVCYKNGGLKATLINCGAPSAVLSIAGQKLVRIPILLLLSKIGIKDMPTPPVRLRRPTRRRYD